MKPNFVDWSIAFMAPVMCGCVWVVRFPPCWIVGLTCSLAFFSSLPGSGVRGWREYVLADSQVVVCQRLVLVAPASAGGSSSHVTSCCPLDARLPCALYSACSLPLIRMAVCIWGSSIVFSFVNFDNFNYSIDWQNISNILYYSNELNLWKYINWIT